MLFSALSLHGYMFKRKSTDPIPTVSYPGFKRLVTGQDDYLRVLFRKLRVSGVSLRCTYLVFDNQNT